MTQSPIQNVEQTYSLYQIEDLTPVVSLKDEDLLIVNILRSDSSYRTSRTTVKDLVDYLDSQGISATVEIEERLNQSRQTFQELRVAVTNATDFDSLKSAMLVALEDWT